MAIKVVTDSSSDLPPELATELDIAIGVGVLKAAG